MSWSKLTCRTRFLKIVPPISEVCPVTASGEDLLVFGLSPTVGLKKIRRKAGNPGSANSLSVLSKIGLSGHHTRPPAMGTAREGLIWAFVLTWNESITRGFSVTLRRFRVELVA